MLWNNCYSEVTLLANFLGYENKVELKKDVFNEASLDILSEKIAHNPFQFV